MAKLESETNNSINYKEKIIELLKEKMTDRGFLFWKALDDKLPDIWDKLSSSTKKYHKKKDGSVPTIAEHTYEMLYSGIKIMRMFDLKPNTLDADVLLMGITLHDALKYGSDGKREHTTKEHDRLIGDLIKNNKEKFKKLFNERQCFILEESVRFHSGRWSTGLGGDFNLCSFNQITLLLHTLDMLSTADTLKTDVS